MALNTVKLNGGTAGNPVVLSARQINGLIALYKDSNVEKDCSGYVKAASGKLAKSEYVYIQNLGFTIVDTVATPDKFTLYAANTNVVYEGKSVQLYSTGIDINDLVLTVDTHEIIISSGAISEEVIKSRIHISETGLVTVDDAEENATWRDIITIQAYPSFDPTNKVLISNPIKIKGIAMSGVNITAASSVLIGGRLNVEVNILPEDHTKNNYRLEISANNGVINNNIYIAPNTPVETAIVAECFLFGGNIATFHVEKNISVKRPVIICDIKDKDGEEVPGAYLSITDGATQTITQLANGENMTVVLNRTYFIQAFVPEGYTKAIFPENITPREVETIVTATYYPVQLGVMAVFADGNYMSFSEWEGLDYPKTFEGNDLIGAGCALENGDIFLIGAMNTSYTYCYSKSNQELPQACNKNLFDEGYIPTIDDVIRANKALVLVVSSLKDNTAENSHVLWTNNQTITINGKTKTAFIGSEEQYKIINDNISNINLIRTAAKQITISFPMAWNYVPTCYYKNNRFRVICKLNDTFVRDSLNGTSTYTSTNGAALCLFDIR